MAKYKLVRDVYSRYGGGGLKTSTFSAKSDEEALCKVMENCMYGAPTDENDNEYGEDGYIVPDKDTLVDRIYSNNGDGCDFIIKLQNMETEEILIECEDSCIEEEEEWGDDDDVEEDDVEEDDDDDNIAYSEEEWDE